MMYVCIVFYNSVRDPCDNSPCVNGGTCVRQDTENFTCECVVGYGGVNCGTGKGTVNLVMLTTELFHSFQLFALQI